MASYLTTQQTAHHQFLESESPAIKWGRLHSVMDPEIVLKVWSPSRTEHHATEWGGIYNVFRFKQAPSAL